jgi:hypothetical protein
MFALKPMNNQSGLTLENKNNRRRRRAGGRLRPYTRRQRTTFVAKPSASGGVQFRWPTSTTTVTVPSTMPIVPDRTVTTLPYTGIINRTLSSFIDDYQFNLNSIFDPDRTGVGHQPLGHDQWSAFYNRYRVLAVELIAEFVNTGALPYWISMSPSTSVTAPTIDNFAEQPYVETGTLPSGGAVGTDPVVLSARWDLPKIAGRSVAEYKSSDLYAALFGANPSETLIAHFVAVQPAGVTTGGSYAMKLQLRYHVELYDRIQLSAS